jgi:glycosyltransferase involved in cell wall biosynthesis
MRVGIVVPHIFMQQALLPEVIFSPGHLALQLAEGLMQLGAEVVLFSPGPVSTKATNITADLSYFEDELSQRGDNYLELLRKHPLTFISLARQVQGELVAKAYAMANSDELDIVHIYANEEDIAVTFAQFCRKPIVFTHHDPYSFTARYRTLFPKYAQYSWLSLSLAQRRDMPPKTNWVGNIYHGLPEELFHETAKPDSHVIAYLGRIIEPKGLHLAIAAIKHHNQTAAVPYRLRIAGKHYASASKHDYWEKEIEPYIDGDEIEHIGFLKTSEQKQKFLGNAAALIIPSTFNEPFGWVMIEALACGTPVIGLDSGAIPEVIRNPACGVVAKKVFQADGKRVDVQRTAANLAQAITKVPRLSRAASRQEFEERFTSEQMCQGHYDVYKKLIK